MSVAVGDVNGDGIPDIIVATRGVRAGKIKVFDGARALNTSESLGPGDTLFQKVVINGYKLGLTVASADVNGDGKDDIIVGARRTTLTNDVMLPATVLILNGDTAGNGFGQMGSFQPFSSSYTGGVYVAARDDGGKASIGVSESNASQVQVWSLATGSPVMTSRFSPFGASTPFTASQGDGQIVAVDTTGSGNIEYATAHLSGGVVNVDVNDPTGAQQGTFKYGTGVTFFALDHVDATQSGVDSLAMASAPNKTNTIDLLDTLTGVGLPSSLNALLPLTGKFTIAGS
jgi:hypothetical protein